MRNGKKKQVLEWLQGEKPLTAVMAMQMFNVIYLSGIIQRLRKDGYDIDTETVITENGERFGRYVMNIKK